MLQKVCIKTAIKHLNVQPFHLQLHSTWFYFESFVFNCDYRYENLKGKYFEIKRAQMNGEQRPYWLYYNEMDYIISHFPGHRPRVNLEANNSVSATSTPNSANASLDTTNNANVTNNSDFGDIKPVRIASLSAVNLDSSKSNAMMIFFGFSWSLFSLYSRLANIPKTLKLWFEKRCVFSHLILVNKQYTKVRKIEMV